MKHFSKKKGELIPGTLIETSTGRFLAFYEHRTDIIANGENEIDAKENLRKMYKTVIKYEDSIPEKKTVDLPPSAKAKQFMERI
jgi:hypothetical protein